MGMGTLWPIHTPPPVDVASVSISASTQKLPSPLTISGYATKGQPPPPQREVAVFDQAMHVQVMLMPENWLNQPGIIYSYRVNETVDTR